MKNSNAKYSRLFSTPSYLSYPYDEKTRSIDRILRDKKLFADNLYNNLNYDSLLYNPYYNSYNSLYNYGNLTHYNYGYYYNNNKSYLNPKKIYKKYDYFDLDSKSSIQPQKTLNKKENKILFDDKLYTKYGINTHDHYNFNRINNNYNLNKFSINLDGLSKYQSKNYLDCNLKISDYDYYKNLNIDDYYDYLKYKIVDYDYLKYGTNDYYDILKSNEYLKDSKYYNESNLSDYDNLLDDSNYKNYSYNNIENKIDDNYKELFDKKDNSKKVIINKNFNSETKNNIDKLKINSKTKRDEKISIIKLKTNIDSNGKSYNKDINIIKSNVYEDGMYLAIL